MSSTFLDWSFKAGRIYLGVCILFTLQQLNCSLQLKHSLLISFPSFELRRCQLVMCRPFRATYRCLMTGYRNRAPRLFTARSNYMYSLSSCSWASTITYANFFKTVNKQPTKSDCKITVCQSENVSANQVEKKQIRILLKVFTATLASQSTVFTIIAVTRRHCTHQHQF